jgi:hypothetical protein
MAGRETLPAERSHFFARRGVPYGARKIADGRFLDEPETGVGLLFLSCHADIRNQFEHVQNRWANDSHFPRLRTGVDPIVGMPGSIVQTHRLNNGEPDLPAIQENIQGFVSLKGGDYFFTPSIPFFLALAASGVVRDLRP